MKGAGYFRCTVDVLSSHPHVLFPAYCRSLVPALMDELRQAGMLHVLVVVGGIIPPQVSTCW